MMTIWEFKTKRFQVMVTAEEEYDLDLSWDETGEVSEKINNGFYMVFCAKAAVFLDGKEIASDYLSQCIYENLSDFKDNLGIAKTPYGSYFSAMVRAVIEEAREYLDKPCDKPTMRKLV